MFCTGMMGMTGPLPGATSLALRTHQRDGTLILVVGTLSLVLMYKFVRNEKWRTIMCIGYVAAWLLMSLFSHHAFAVGLASRLVR